MTDRRSWLTDRRSWVTDRRSWVTDRRSWVTDRRSWVNDRGSWAVDRRSWLDDFLPLAYLDSTYVNLSESIYVPNLHRQVWRDEDQASSLGKRDDDLQYPAPLPLALLTLGICLAAFIVALDRTIVSTAIPQITDDFHTPEDVGWYGSAYLLTSCAFQPIYGRIFKHFDVRWSFITALTLFEIGSLICGVAPNSVTLIVGRAIAGLGCAGVFAGVLVIISLSVPLEKRPVFTALIGSIFGVGAICGPIIGGTFTSKVSWRWCFYLNLPVGAITFITLILFFHPENQPLLKESFSEKLRNLDAIGNFILITSVTMLLLALQWGGLSYKWSSPRIIGLLVGAGVEGAIWVAWLFWRGDTALIPIKIVSQRTVAASFLQAFFLSGTLLILIYYVPYWFQAIRDDTAIESGIHTIPYLASNFVFSMISGALVQKSGYFNPPAIIGCGIACVGCGLLTTLDTGTTTGEWIGYEILVGAGIGTSIQQGIVAVQNVLPMEDVPIATSLILFSQSLAGAIFVSVGSSLLRNKLEDGLEGAQLPGVSVAKVLGAGATELKNLIPVDQLGPVLKIYNHALDQVFIVAVPLAAISMVCALGMEWTPLKRKK